MRFPRSTKKVKPRSRVRPRWLAGGFMALALFIAGCGSTLRFEQVFASSGVAGVAGVPAPSAGGSAQSLRALRPAANASGIPQNNGGDQDADNNGGPSDGDGDT